jgi:MFS family permease
MEEAPASLCSHTLLYAFVLMLGAVNFGYNMAYHLPSIPDMQHSEEYNTSSTKRPYIVGYWTLFKTITSFSAVFGPIITFVGLRWIGRRLLTFILACAATLFWLLFLAIRPDSIWLGILVRALSGLGVGGFSALIPLYMVELAPPESTGFFGTLNQAGIASGFVVCYVIALGILGDPPKYAEHHAWMILAGAGAAITFLLACLVWFVDESPVQATKSYSSSDDQSDTSISEGIPDRLCAWTWLRNLLICGALMLFQQTTGVNVIIMNLDDIDPSLVMTVLTCIAQVAACVVGAFLIEKLGRRAIWTFSLAGCGLTCGMYALIKALGASRGITIAVTFVFLFCYGFGAGPIPWFFVPEFFRPSLRSAAMSIIASVNWIFAFVVIILQAGARKQLGSPFAFFVFAVLSVGGAVFGFFLVRNPERAARKAQVLHTGIFDDLSNV